MAAQERGIRHCVTGGMVVGHRFPSAMLDRNPGFRANRLEGNVYVGDLIRGEAHLASHEGEPDAGLPDHDPADLEDAAIGVCLGERPAFARLEGERASSAPRELKQGLWPPPSPDLGGEDGEGALGTRGPRP